MQKNKRFAVFWHNPDPTLGSEFNKIRPCVVVSPEAMNKTINTVVVVPLTSTFKSWPFRTEIAINGQRSSVACDHIRSVDKQRLMRHIKDLSAAEGEKILAVLQTMFAY